MISTTETPTEPSPRTARILIVEDDPDCNAGWSVWLRHLGYEVLSAFDGAAGLASLEADGPRPRPARLGSAARSRLQDPARDQDARGSRHPSWSSAPNRRENSDRRARKLGAAAVFSKPAAPADLEAMIEALLHGDDKLR